MAIGANYNQSSSSSNSNSSPINGAAQLDRFNWMKEAMSSVDPSFIKKTKNQNWMSEADYDALPRERGWLGTVLRPKYADIYGEGTKNGAEFNSTIQAPEYGGFSVQDPGASPDVKALSDAYAAPIARQQELSLEANDQAMADRGIYTSMNALRSNNDVREGYAPQFAAAGGRAMEAKSGYDLNRAGMLNSVNADQAKTAFDAKWRPLDFAMGGWTGNGGQVSSSSSSSSSKGGGFSL